MSKDKISDYSSTANSNTDIAGINIDEGCAPSGINDAIRTLMAQLKTWQSGGQDVYIHPAGTASAPSITANGDTNTGIFFPAADTVGITTGGTDRVRVDSSGNLIVNDTALSGSWNKAVRINGSNGSSASDAGIELVGYRTGDGDVAAIAFYNAASSNVRLGQIYGERSGANNSGALTFHTTNAGTGAERVKILSTGGTQFNYGISVGGTAPASEGSGVKFPATQIASSDANTLDDYEEGTWTPALTGATFSTTGVGSYVKVGQVVTVWGYMSFSYSSPTSAFYINNLPFTVFNDSSVRGGAGTVMCQSGVTFNNYVTLEPINNAVIAYFESNTSGGNRTDMGSSNFSSGGSVIRFTATYRTSA